MTLRDMILAEHSKAQKDKIVKWVGHSQERFDRLFYLFLNDEYLIQQRASYPLSYCIEEHPDLINKHFGKLIKNLRKKGLHDAVRRRTVRILQQVPVPKRYHGELMDICFNFITLPEEKVAVKAFSLTVLEKLLPLYPEIKNELKLVIQERWDHETVAFRSRAHKILKRL